MSLEIPAVDEAVAKLMRLTDALGNLAVSMDAILDDLGFIYDERPDEETERLLADLARMSSRVNDFVARKEQKL